MRLKFIESYLAKITKMKKACKGVDADTYKPEGR